MRTIQIIIFTFIAVPFIMAQPVLTNSMNFAIGDSYRMDSYIDLTTANPGASGANVSWDFETITGGTYIEGTTAICVDPSGTPFADSAVVAISNMCIRPVESPYHGAYQYYNSGAGSRDLLAMGWFETGNTSFGTYQGPLKALEFPLGFNDSFSGTYDYTSYHLDFGYYFMRDSAEVETVADAWGTLKTPIGEFENVLRLKTITTSYSWYRFEAGTPWMFMGVFTDIQYDWYLPGIKVPLLILQAFDYSENSFYNILFLAEYNFLTKVGGVEQTKINLFPNPSTDQFTILSDGQEIIRISLYNQQGQKVLEQSGENKNINVSMFKPGLYMVYVQTPETVIQQKIIIK
jgi:hypothetical protein